MKPRAEMAGALCPVEGHGPLLLVDQRLFCPHDGHDGRPKTHPAGPAPRTSPFPVPEPRP